MFKPGDDYAFPHSNVDGKLQVIPFHDLDNAGPAGSINSSVAEMCKWLLLQLNHGKFPDRDGRLFTEAQSREMWASQTILPIPPDETGPLGALRGHFRAYGFGWFLTDYKGRKLIGHTGGVAGFVTRVQLVPEENLGIVVLTNAEQTGAMDSITDHIVDAYLGGSTSDWIAAYKGQDDQDAKDAAEITRKASSGRATNSKPSLAPEKYASVYTDPWYGPATIKLENSQLIFSLDHTPSAIADLEHWQYDTFKAHWRDRTIEDAFVTFSLKPDGTIDHFKMAAVSPLADFSFDYQDLYFTPQTPQGAK